MVVASHARPMNLQRTLHLPPRVRPNGAIIGTRRPRSNQGRLSWLSTYQIAEVNNLQSIATDNSKQQLLASYLQTDDKELLLEEAPESHCAAEDIPETVTNKYDISTLQKKTQHYLNEEVFPVGSFDLDLFEEARGLIWAWSEQGSAESVQQSFQLLRRLVDEQGSNFHPDLNEKSISHLLNTPTLNTVVKNWYTCWQHLDEIALENLSNGGSTGIPRPQDVLATIENLADKCPSLGPQTKCYAIIMRAILYRIKTVEEAEYVESLLTKMVKGYQSGDNRKAPTIVEYNIVISAMANVAKPERAEAILRRLCDDFKAGLSKLAPNAFSFGSVLFAWGFSKQKDGGQRAQDILDMMIDMGEQMNDKSLARPSARCYNSVLQAWCRPQTQSGTTNAERFLQRMQEDYRLGNDEARPSAESYGLIIHNWSLMGCAEQSEKVLRLLCNDYKRNGNHLAKPTSFQFNSAISAWPRSRASHALDRAFSVFDYMKELEVAPDSATFGCLMLSLSRSNDRLAGEKAENLLRMQQELFKEGNDACKCDTLHYNAAMHCWSLVGNAPRAIKLLSELIQEHKRGNVKITDERPFITAFAALARSKDRTAGERGEVIFDEMVQMCDAGELAFEPSTICYTGLQGCWASVERPISGEKCVALLGKLKEKYNSGEASMRPAESNYKVAIDAFARIGQPERAEEIWYEMLQDFLSGNSDAKPGSESCVAVIAAWLTSNAPEAMQRALDLIDRIAEVDRSDAIELKIDLNDYYLLLDICSKSDNPCVLAGGEEIVKKMKVVHAAGFGAVGPDTRCYNIAINCWGKHGSAQCAEALFWDMYTDFLENDNKAAKPDVFTVSTVLTAWRRSHIRNAPERAQVYFERIQKIIDTGKLDLKLDAACYASMLNCLANANSGDATDAAELIFSKLKKQHRDSKDKTIQPTYHLYYAFIKCLANVGRMEGAEEVLVEMYTLYHNGRKDLEPKNYFFAQALNGWFRLGGEEAPERADKLLRWMDCNLPRYERPDCMQFVSLLRCWARSRHPDSGKRCESLLHQCANRFGSHRPLIKDCCADVVCALARTGNPDRAEKLLVRMCDDYIQHEKGSPPATPHLRAFISVLAHLRKTSSGSISLRALRLVQTLRDVDADHKTTWKYNNVLDVWENLSSEKSPEARLDSFLSKMEELDSYSIVGAKSNAKSTKDIPFSLKY